LRKEKRRAVNEGERKRRAEDELKSDFKENKREIDQGGEKKCRGNEDVDERERNHQV
jgi:hypothetical protein